MDVMCGIVKVAIQPFAGIRRRPIYKDNKRGMCILELPYPLLHLLLNCLVCVHESLLVDDNLGRVCSWSANA